MQTQNNLVEDHIALLEHERAICIEKYRAASTDDAKADWRMCWFRLDVDLQKLRRARDAEAIVQTKALALAPIVPKVVDCGQGKQTAPTKPTHSAPFILRKWEPDIGLRTGTQFDDSGDRK